MKQRVIFNSLEQAENYKARDDAYYFATLPENIRALTNEWSFIESRLDGRYSYVALDGADYVGLEIIDYIESDYIENTWEE